MLSVELGDASENYAKIILMRYGTVTSNKNNQVFSSLRSTFVRDVILYRLVAVAKKACQKVKRSRKPPI